MAKLSAVRSLWTARKLYGGSLYRKEGGVLPPTDARLEDLTDEQIELDIELYLMDHPELKRKAEAYKDTEYERAMKEEIGEEPPQEAMPPLPGDFAPVPYDE